MRIATTRHAASRSPASPPRSSCAWAVVASIRGVRPRTRIRWRGGASTSRPVRRSSTAPPGDGHDQRTRLPPDGCLRQWAQVRRLHDAGDARRLRAPRLSSALTLEAWVALAAYPWNWAPMVSQEREPRRAMPSPSGREGNWPCRWRLAGSGRRARRPRDCLSGKWVHVAATFDASQGLAVYIDGAKAGSLPTSGSMTPAAAENLIMGMNREKRMPRNVVGKGAGTIPAGTRSTPSSTR